MHVRPFNVEVNRLRVAVEVLPVLACFFFCFFTDYGIPRCSVRTEKPVFFYYKEGLKMKCTLQSCNVRVGLKF
jgi:hypothetical protein